MSVAIKSRKNKQTFEQRESVVNIFELDQLSLFEITDNGKDNVSNTIDIYDALPKYVWTDKVHKDIDRSQISRKAIINKVNYIVTITAANIDRDKERFFVYPGEREEIVEDALRKIAVNGNTSMIEVDQQKNAGIVFSFYQLRNELQTQGHSYSLDEIKEAIQILANANLACQTADKETSISAPFFPVFGYTKVKSGDMKCYVQFNPLVTRSILNQTFRQIDYQKSMSIRSPLARHIYKRMVQYWKQASKEHPYTPSMVSFLEQSSRGLSKQQKNNIAAMRNAMDVLKRHDVIESWQEKIIRQGNKIIDIQYEIYPSENFIQAVKAANYHQRSATIKNAKLCLAG